MVNHGDEEREKTERERGARREKGRSILPLPPLERVGQIPPPCTVGCKAKWNNDSKVKAPLPFPI